MITSVLFDLDGTIIDSAQIISEVLNRLRRDQGKPELSLSDFRMLVSLGPQALVATALDLDLGDHPLAVKNFRTLYANVETPRSCLNEGAVETFVKLHSFGILMGLVSNKPEYLCWKVLKELQILQWFDTVVGGDSVPEPKPSAEPLWYALSNLDADLSNAVYIGDTSTDQIASESAGIRFVYYNSKYDDTVKEDTTWANISKLDEIVTIVTQENDIHDNDE